MRLVDLLAVCFLFMGCGGGDDGAEADGDADADSDADSDTDADADALCALPSDARTLELDLLVDGNRVRTCTLYWRLNIRVCGEAADPLCESVSEACGACGGAIDRDCDLGDACEESSVRLATAGTYTVCVEAELVNGGIAFEECGEVTVGEEGITEPLAMDIDTGNVFPCVRDWVYDPEENMCCDDGQGYCAPPGF
ncbi:MAG: hypothetical protein HYY06_07545 [Deltaproteobacteria bacterium]|nr:hypothetical protein [Deltaproteobacteria bacterium]